MSLEYNYVMPFSENPYDKFKTQKKMESERKVILEKYEKYKNKEQKYKKKQEKYKVKEEKNRQKKKKLLESSKILII